ncbi:translation initiation factor eIF 4e-like domain-containing protein [Cubamyces lactineus]|nr:translation initiation factor eIF 4e-like domain-containing protein [Cubamyces lactineus]
MGKDDDHIPEGYQYEWTPKSDISLQEFLAKYKPSMVQNDGTKPWLWVRKAEDLPKEGGSEATVEEASKLLSEITERVQNIQNDTSIPIRSNKKKGLKSKKELREEVQHEATEKLKQISERHGYVSGKWLIFAPTDKVDIIWNSIATSLVSGPLSSTSAFLAKVATSPQSETPNYSHLICVYVPDVYDKASITEVMKVLLRNHGMNLMGVKSNLYTSIGIDSKHPSGISSTVWKNTALMKDTEIKALKDEYFAELSTAKAAATEEATAKKAASGETKKSKPKLKKKANDGNPFGSDDEDEHNDDKPSAPEPKAKGKKPALRKKVPAQEFASDSEAGDDGPSETKESQAKGASKRGKSDESDGSDDQAPKKKRSRS